MSHTSKKLRVALGVAGASLVCCASAQAASNTVAVPANAVSGVDSGHVFQAGQDVIISATGTWSGEPGSSVSADGMPTTPSGHVVPDATRPGTQIYELIGSTDGGASWFEVQSGPTRISTTGPLLLAMNDTTSGYADNTGSVSATITDVVTASAPESVSASVTPDLSISVAPSLSLGTLVPSLSSASTNSASTDVTVTSTAADVSVSVSDPSSGSAKGHLVNSTSGPSGSTEGYVLANALQVAGPSGVFGSLDAASVLVFSDALSATSTAGEYSETTPVTFRQTVNANEGLRSGTYAKALTFTAQTTTP